MKLSESLKEILSTVHNINPDTEYRPAYGGESVGLDLYYAGHKTLTLEGIHDRTNNTNDKVLIPTGVHLALPLGYVALIKDRGSISKTNLVRRAGVIDPGYTGEIFVNLATVNNKPCVIKPGSKLPVQLVVVKAETDFEAVSDDVYSELTESSNRGKGKIGSSD